VGFYTTSLTANTATITNIYATNIGGDLLEIGAVALITTNSDPLFIMTVNDTAKFSQGYSYSGDYFYLRDVEREKDRIHITPSFFEIYGNGARPPKNCAKYRRLD
jgi:hypothetical protein